MQRTIEKIIKRSFNLLLYSIFKFDRWHILSNYDYIRPIIDYLNQNLLQDNKELLVEIGCGLGNICRQTSYARVIGLDCDRNVIRANDFLNKFSFKRSCTFKHFNLFEDDLAKIIHPDIKINVLLMVNFLHGVDPVFLRHKLAEYFDRNLVGSVIMDVRTDAGFRYQHNIEFLTQKIKNVVVKELLDEIFIKTKQRVFILSVC